MNKRQLQILELLSNREWYALDLAKALNNRWWQLPIYWHLAELENLGLVTSREEPEEDFPRKLYRRVSG